MSDASASAVRAQDVRARAIRGLERVGAGASGTDVRRGTDQVIDIRAQPLSFSPMSALAARSGLYSRQLRAPGLACATPEEPAHRLSRTLAQRDALS